MKKIYTLKVLITIYDTEIDRKRFKNEIFECSEKRALQILSYDKLKLVEILSIIRK